MKRHTMCVTHSCKLKGVKRTVLGGCEKCGGQLVPWEDPDIPSVETLAKLVVNVALFEGKMVPLEPVERTLRDSLTLKGAWEIRYRETREAEGAGQARHVTKAQWNSLFKVINEDVSAEKVSVGFPRREGDPCAVVEGPMSPNSIRHVINSDGTVEQKERQA